MPRTFAVCAFVALALGCQPRIPEGRFQCSTDDDCPPDFVCRVDLDRCYETPGDPPDGG